MTLLVRDSHVKSFGHLCPRGHRDTSPADSRIGLLVSDPARQAKHGA
jgi:hypothetical protein